MCQFLWLTNIIIPAYRLPIVLHSEPHRESLLLSYKVTPHFPLRKQLSQSSSYEILKTEQVSCCEHFILPICDSKQLTERTRDLPGSPRGCSALLNFNSQDTWGTLRSCSMFAERMQPWTGLETRAVRLQGWKTVGTVHFWYMIICCTFYAQFVALDKSIC